MSFNPISDGKGEGEQDFPLSERAPVNAHQPWTVGHWQLAYASDSIHDDLFYACSF